MGGFKSTCNHEWTTYFFDMRPLAGKLPFTP